MASDSKSDSRSSASKRPSSGGVAVATSPGWAGAAGSSSSSGRAPAHAFSPEEVVGGRYRVVRYLASGGMGDVYEVEDPELGERLALKTLRPGLAAEEAARERFKREIQLARRVTHQNVCRLYDAGVHTGEAGVARPYLTMELLLGETLDARITREGRLDPRVALPIARQMAAGLDAAHRVAIVHRDFKSGNVVLVQDGAGERAVITDFGLARALGVETGGGLFETLASSGGLQGTAAFVAPEQVAEGEISARTDVYAFGVVLFHMVTGAVPFKAGTPIGTAVRRLEARPPSPRTIVPGLPARWEAVILRCLERQPEDRFGSAGEVVAALEGRRPVGGRAFRRRAWTLGGATAVALLIAAGLFFSRWSQPAPTVTAPGDPIQLTADPGLEIDPTFSPDGSLVAYASDVGDTFEIVLRPLTPGGQAVAVTADGGQNVQPAWSPDGALLAFASESRNGIWVVPARGGVARRLTELGARPAWSPDGKWIVFQEDSRHEVAERSVPALPPSRLWVVSRDGGEPRPLTRAGEPAGGHGEPAWSPDGRRIAFSASDRRRSEIWSVAADGSDPRPLAREAWVNLAPVYAHDGRSLFYVSIASAGSQAAAWAVWRLPLDAEGGPAGPATRVSSLVQATIRQLAVAPDGREIVYSAVTTVSRLMELPLRADGGAAGEPRDLTAAEASRSSRPAFSPDGSTLAFDRWQVGTNLNLWLLGNGESRPLTESPEWDSQASWFADGRRIAFLADRGGRRGLWSIDVETRGETFLADLGTDTDWARLSPDGTRVAYHSRAGGGTLDVYVADLRSDERLRLTRDPELAGWPIWSPDGQSLAIERRRGQNVELAVMPAGGGAIEVLHQASGELWPFSWSPDGDRLVYAVLENGVWSLEWVSRSTQERRRLTTDLRLAGYLRYPAWSPRGDRLVYERAATVGDLWRVELGR